MSDTIKVNLVDSEEPSIQEKEEEVILQEITEEESSEETVQEEAQELASEVEEAIQEQQVLISRLEQMLLDSLKKQEVIQKELIEIRSSLNQ